MKKPSRIKKVTPNAVVKRMKFGKHRISCCLDHFGDGGPGEAEGPDGAEGNR